MVLPKHYHRDWQRKRAITHPEWYLERKQKRAQLRRDNKAKAVIFMGNKCAHCLQSFPDCCYDFHHTDPLLDNDVPSKVLHCSWKRIIDELSLCIMLCSNCHRIVHNKDEYVAHSKRNQP